MPIITAMEWGLLAVGRIDPGNTTARVSAAGTTSMGMTM
jgi:hypothetical protein